MPERVGASGAVRGVEACRELGLEVAQQGAELLDPVLHGRAGEQEHVLGRLGEGRDGHRPLRERVLHVVRLVHDERDRPGGRERLRPRAPQAREGHDGDAARRAPRGGLFPVLAVDGVHREVRVRAQLAHPVLQHARRAHDERVGRAAGDQVRDDGDGLHRLAQAHLVAQDDAPLGEREAGSERLVPAQRDRQQRLVERLRLHAVDQLGGQVPGRGGDVAARGATPSSSA